MLQKAARRESAVTELKNGDGVSYTVPQHIRPERIEKAARTIFFRVNRICGKSEIVVSDGERKLCAFPREHLAPGEMEHILLPRKLLGENPPTQLTVSICEKQA